MAVIQTWRTRDGEHLVVIHDDQTAELFGPPRGREPLTGRRPLYVITDKMHELGVTPDDLVQMEG